MFSFGILQLEPKNPPKTNSLDTSNSIYRGYNPSYPFIYYIRPFLAAPFHLGKVGGTEADENSRRWYHFNDATVLPVVNESEIVSREAYLLFYERV